MPSPGESSNTSDLLSCLSSCDQLFQFDSDDESSLLGEVLDTKADIMTAEASKIWLTEILLHDGKSKETSQREKSQNKTQDGTGEKLHIGISEKQEIYMVIGHCGIKLE